MASIHVCSYCASVGKTCCQETEIYLTMGDIRRIAAYVSRIDFYEYRQPADPSYLVQDDDPVWAQQTIRSDGSRRVVRHDANRNCTFLTAAGCQLPMQTRPLVCRIYPYTYTIAGIEAALDERCRQAYRESDHELIGALGMSPDQARAWHMQLYEEIFMNEGVDGNGDWHRFRPAI